LGVASEYRFAWLHPPDDHTPEFDLALVLEPVNGLETADAIKEFIHILHAAPFAVADDVQAGLLLQPDGEADHIVHGRVEIFGRQFGPPRQQIADRLGPR
jgi:hypothetical protein